MDSKKEEVKTYQVVVVDKESGEMNIRLGISEERHEEIMGECMRHLLSTKGDTEVLSILTETLKPVNANELAWIVAVRYKTLHKYRHAINDSEKPDFLKKLLGLS